MKKPTRFMIHVQDGEIKITPHSDKVSREGIIEWRCEQGCIFAINLGYNLPCEEQQHQGKKGEPIEVHVRSDAPFGEYKYTIAVFKDEKLLIEDPRFIVRP